MEISSHFKVKFKKTFFLDGFGDVCTVYKIFFNLKKALVVIH